MSVGWQVLYLLTILQPRATKWYNSSILSCLSSLPRKASLGVELTFPVFQSTQLFLSTSAHWMSGWLARFPAPQNISIPFDATNNQPPVCKLSFWPRELCNWWCWLKQYNNSTQQNNNRRRRKERGRQKLKLTSFTAELCSVSLCALSCLVAQ